MWWDQEQGLRLDAESLATFHNGIFFGSLLHFNKRKHTISDWLVKLEKRFILASVEDNARKIKFCQVFIGQTGEDILAQLIDDTSWEETKGGVNCNAG